jgi:glycosyltransferase involved in cell wall biosynthesis
MNDFSIIIPTLNEQDYITDLLTDISNQTIKPKKVIVVDGFSKDKTRKMIKKFPFVTLLNCPSNIASQRNFGAKNTTAKTIIFLDADTRLRDKKFLKNLIIQFSKSKSDIACPFYLPYKSTFTIFFIYLFFNCMFFLFQKLSASGAGSTIIIKSKVFKNLAGFNTNIKFEDIELIRRASKKYSFSMINSFIWVSDRRFRKYGTLRTTIQYLILSVLFLFNQFNLSPGISYSFGKFRKLEK